MGSVSQLNWGKHVSRMGEGFNELPDNFVLLVPQPGIFECGSVVLKNNVASAIADSALLINRYLGCTSSNNRQSPHRLDPVKSGTFTTGGEPPT